MSRQGSPLSNQAMLGHSKHRLKNSGITTGAMSAFLRVPGVPAAVLASVVIPDDRVRAALLAILLTGVKKVLDVVGAGPR